MDNAELAAFAALPLREQMACFTASLVADAESHAEFPIRHGFAPGMYIREIFIPKGAVVVGKIHRMECVNVCIKGDIDILTEKGKTRITAPFIGTSPPGTQKIGYAYEDTVWINIFRSDETDVQKLEQEIAYSEKEAIALIDPDGKYFKKKELACQ